MKLHSGPGCGEAMMKGKLGRLQLLSVLVASLGLPARAAAPARWTTGRAAARPAAPAPVALGAMALQPAARAPVTPQPAGLRAAAAQPAAPAPAALPSAVPAAASHAAPAGADAPEPEAEPLRAAAESLENSGADAEAGALAGRRLFDGARPDADPAAVPAPPDARTAELNRAIVEALKPFHDKNPSSRAELEFQEIVTNDKRVVKLALNGSFAKTGPLDSIRLTVSDFVYSFPEAPGARPKLHARLSLAWNLHKHLTRDEINKWGAMAETMAEQYLRSALRYIGPGATAEAAVTRRETDGRRNITGLSLEARADIDLAKLPPGMDPKAIRETGLRVEADADLKGVQASVSITGNPGYRGYDDDSKGIKEMMDKLLARDPEDLAAVYRAVESVDRLASYLTHGKDKPGRD